ncbi:hypothetical protein K1T71_002707 [Dendrolimus kikuchii]|uniref:Uncharacterized protein n=1 Tax=Dendrolimus kikuchii TaxID=765133 RepID=A0ACC1DDS2_9NEOP|nr:hypothetical protein K1T71_002707 [Dendrolimus kikuchii]
MNSLTIIQTKQYRSTGEERVHQCGECGLTLSTRSALTAHARSHRAAADAHRCDVCYKTFAVPARLRPFECEYCHKMFSVKENLQVHRRIHTKERPYRCNVCDAAFEHSGKLNRHARTHTGERPHACPQCHKTFIQSGQLVIHLRTHTGEKPYRCPAPGCGKGFTCSKQLKVHSRTHTGERPYTCDICLRDFGYNHVLKLHRFQHYGERCYRCTVCDGTFNTKKQMEAHIYKEHGADTPRGPQLQSTVPLVVNGNVMCDLVEAALQQLPPTPPSSPPSPQCPPAPAAPTVTAVPPTQPTTVSPNPPATELHYILEPSSLPHRKRKLIPQIDPEPIPVVRHTSVIQVLNIFNLRIQNECELKTITKINKVSVLSVTIPTRRVTPFTVDSTTAAGRSVSAAGGTPATATRHPTYLCLARRTLDPIATPLLGDYRLTFRTLQCLPAFY